ncbi:MAG: ABC transporter, partial [Candidatus Schekmanbacteria bacterium GWA2_38_11]
MIEVKNLTKYYRGIRAVEDVNFNVERGEIVGLLGPNGAGKTTTMRIITGFIPATKGEVKVAGFDVFENPLEIKNQIGYLPETPPLYKDMVVTSFLEFAGRLRGVERDKIGSRINYVLERCGILDVKDRLIGNLSKGYKQRVGVAQALIHDPEVLVLDEPTIGLDPKQITEIRHLIKELGGEHTIILSTHILPEVTMTCQRVIIINEGKVVATDSFEGLSAKLRKSEKIFIRVSRVDESIFNRLEMIKGITHISKDGSSENSLIVESELGFDV